MQAITAAHDTGDAGPSGRRVSRSEAVLRADALARRPHNVDHPEATRFAQEARIIAQAVGHKPSPDLAYNAPPVFLFEPHQPEQCNYKPNVILNIDDVWETKRRAFEILAGKAPVGILHARRHEPRHAGGPQLRASHDLR